MTKKHIFTNLFIILIAISLLCLGIKNVFTRYDLSESAIYNVEYSNPSLSKINNSSILTYDVNYYVKHLYLTQIKTIFPKHISSIKIFVGSDNSSVLNSMFDYGNPKTVCILFTDEQKKYTIYNKDDFGSCLKIGLRPLLNILMWFITIMLIFSSISIISYMLYFKINKITVITNDIKNKNKNTIKNETNQSIYPDLEEIDENQYMEIIKN